MCANAAAARRRRSSSVKPPAAIACRVSAYWIGLVTTATLAWFLAAARTMAGPPMSICSMTSASFAPDATVSSNGYRFETSSWNGAIPRSSSCCSWAGLVMSASRPACTFGCSVFTRPSRHSGKPVRSSTLVTGTPACSMALAVLPVETISTPASWRALCQVVYAGLVVDADQRPPDRDPSQLPILTFLPPVSVQPSRAILPTVATSSARSATLMRSCSVSSSSSSCTGTAA